MTEKEAIYILRNVAWLGSDADKKKVEEAVEVVANAIEALNNSEIPNSFGKDTNVPSKDCIDRAEAQTAIQFAARRYTVAHEAHGEGRVVWSDILISVTDAMNALREVPPAQPEPIRINLNEPIKVKLTDWGKEIYYHRYDRINQIVGREVCKPSFPKEDENGYTEFQLWCFMELYGECMGMTLPNVIEPLEIVYER